MPWQKVARADTIPAPGLRRVTVGGHDYLIIHLGSDAWRATDLSCTHAFAPLDKGRLEDETLTCFLHGARFNASDGTALGPPAVRPLRVFPVRIEDGDVVVDIPEGDEPPRRPAPGLGGGPARTG